MAENTIQYDWIVKITGGLRHIFADNPNVFIAGDLFWYPVEGRPDIRVAPDTMVVFGRPCGHRMSYKQWEEQDIPPQVVFEVLSPSNREREMLAKLEFYADYGVEEYYVYDPDPERLDLIGYLRRGKKLLALPNMNGFVSPRLNVRFEMGPEGLVLIGPNGESFETFEEVHEAKDHLKRELALERQNAEQERHKAEQERLIADRERQKAEQEKRRADELQVELDRLRRSQNL